jgi:hypothetical protein
MYTELAKEKMEFIDKFYPKLKEFYQPMMGNFAFTDEELESNMKDVLNFIRDESGYFLLSQEGVFYLTDFLE